MVDPRSAPTARFVAHSVFTMLETRGWDRPRSRWVVAEAPGRSRADHGVEAFRTYEDDLGRFESDDGLIGRRAGPEVAGMAVAGALAAPPDASPTLRTVLAVDRDGHWFRVAGDEAGVRIETDLPWFDGPGSALRCYLGAPWLGPVPPPPWRVFARWWVAACLAGASEEGDGTELVDLVRRLNGLTTLQLRTGWVPLVPRGWWWPEVRTAWEHEARRRGDTELAALVGWADGPELAARVARSTPVVHPDAWSGVVDRATSTSVLDLLEEVGVLAPAPGSPGRRPQRG